MGKIEEIHPPERDEIRGLFVGNKRDRVLIDCVLEDHLGAAHADSADSPAVARLDYGVFTILGGDPHHPLARDLIRHQPIQFVSPESERWHQLLEDEFGERMTPLEYTTFDSRSLDVEHLETLAASPPADFRIAKMDLSLAAQLLRDFDTNQFTDSFESVEEFAARGVGYLALNRGKIVSAATSFAASRKGIDIDIQTKPEFRRRGLATAVGSRLLLYCLENRIEPHWLSANEPSDGLALKLGYSKGDSYITFMVR